jgi:hypothetical protein
LFILEGRLPGIADGEGKQELRGSASASKNMSVTETGKGGKKDLCFLFSATVV